MPVPDLLADARRQLEICNACRYCEGYCAVFPALERRRHYSDGDVRFIANLCHDCRACYYACPFASPHEFAVDLPVILSGVRRETYRHYAWPRALRGLYASSITVVLRAVLLGLIAMGTVSLALAGPEAALSAHQGPGSFYAVVPWLAMVIPALLGSAFVFLAWWASGFAFWRDSAPEEGTWPDLGALMGAGADVLRMRWLRGGGPGCPYPDERPSRRRWLLHGLVFYGFLACFASTAVAALYQDVLDILPPYPLLSLPVVLGTVGGVAMVAGAAGSLVSDQFGDRRVTDPQMSAADQAFVGLLGLASLTGLATLALRDSDLMGVSLVVHLGVLAALYVMAPYSKFVHLVYRLASLVRDHAESLAERRA